MHTEDLTLNNLKWVKCHKTKQNKAKPYIFVIYVYREFNLNL